MTQNTEREREREREKPWQPWSLQAVSFHWDFCLLFHPFPSRRGTWCLTTHRITEWAHAWSNAGRVWQKRWVTKERWWKKTLATANIAYIWIIMESVNLLLFIPSAIKTNHCSEKCLIFTMLYIHGKMYINNTLATLNILSSILFPMLLHT